MSDEKDFEKAANLWLKERMICVQEDELSVEHIMKLIVNLRKQINVSLERIDLSKKRASRYIKEISEECNVEKEYVHFFKEVTK